MIRVSYVLYLLLILYLLQSFEAYGLLKVLSMTWMCLGSIEVLKAYNHYKLKDRGSLIESYIKIAAYLVVLIMGGFFT